MAHGTEGEIADHVFQARQAAFQVGVVAKVAEPAGVGNARLVGVDFPGMQVKNLRFGLIVAGTIK